MTRCKICGKFFKLKKDNLYEIPYTKINGELVRSLECFDCPRCGCQNAVNIREHARQKARNRHDIQSH